MPSSDSRHMSIPETPKPALWKSLFNSRLESDFMIIDASGKLTIDETVQSQINSLELSANDLRHRAYHKEQEAQAIMQRVIAS